MDNRTAVGTRAALLAAMFLVVFMLGCRTDSPAPAPAETKKTPASASCDALDRAECLRAVRCTLLHVKQMVYQCRPSVGPCETGLLQTDKAACEKRDGCSYDGGGCYCPFPGYGRTAVEDKEKNKGGACVCGGGPPPMCVPAKAEDDPRRIGGSGYRLVRGPDYEGVIIPASEEAHMGMLNADGARITGYWTPDDTSIAALETGLEAHLRGHKSQRAHGLGAKVSGYKRQYVGFLLGERKVIYANCFCHAAPGWKERQIGVDDGGDCYFQVVFDPSTGKYTDLYINGPG